MAVEISWLDEERQFIFQRYIGRWTLHDYRDCAKAADALMDTVSHPVTIIADFSKSGMPPLGILKDSEKMMTSSSRHPLFRRLLIVSPNAFIRLLIETGRRLTPQAAEGVHEFATIDEALAFARENPLKP